MLESLTLEDVDVGIKHGKVLSVVVVGQTPPPYGGQAIMMQAMLEGRYRNVELHHVRMAFSKEMDQIGRFQVKKVGHLLALVLRITLARLRTRSEILFYPPASPQRVPLYRDLFLLTCVRWMFKRTIFRFDACGLTDMYGSLNTIERGLFRLAYRNPDVVIRLSEQLPADGKQLGAKDEMIVPNAVPILPATTRPRGGGIPRILFLGVVSRSKGIEVLLKAVGRLRRQGLEFHLDIVGEPLERNYLMKAMQISEQEGIADRVIWRGRLIGAEKQAAYDRADIFCLPTFVGSETMPLVLLEAMRAGLPIVSTKWRAIPEVVDDGRTGILVPVDDHEATFEALERLVTDTTLRERMGQAGRRRFEERFTLEHFRDRMQAVFDTCSNL